MTSSTSTISTIRRRRDPSVCRPAWVPRSFERWTRLSKGSKSEMPTVVEGDEFKRAHAAARGGARDQEPARSFTELESLGQDARLRHPRGARRRPDVPDPPRQAGERRAVRRARRVDEARARRSRRSKLTREVEKAARLVRAQSAGFEAAREAAFSKAATSGHRRRRSKAARARQFGDARTRRRGVARAGRIRRSSRTGTTSSRSTKTTGEERRSREERERDDPELATRLSRFKVNLLVSHEPGSPAPVVYDTNPTYPNLFGYLERRARFGALLTDFTRIRAGSLHTASGRRARRARGRPPDRSHHLGADEARPSRAAHRRRGSARTARPLRDVAPAGAGADPRARRARRLARALRDAARRRPRLRGALPREGRGRADHPAHARAASSRSTPT